MSIPLSRRCVAELFGTFLLVMLGPGAVMVAARTHAFGHAGVALSFGLAVTVIVAAGGRLSGAHVNPAVTIGLWTVRRFPWSEVLPYVAAQCVGAVLASLISGWLLGPVGGWGTTVPSLALAQSFVVEMGFSGVLGFVILAVANDDRSTIAPFAIGATIFAGALTTGPLTGGSFNPARSLGPAIASGIWTAHWIDWLAPITGVTVGMWAFTLLQSESRTMVVPFTRMANRSVGVTAPTNPPLRQ
jgi:MIP family channel proteins